MINKKLGYKILLIIVLVLGYFNYFVDEKKVSKKEQVVETTGAVYNTDGYNIEAEKQKDFLEKDQTIFEKAKAIFEGTILTGDNGFLDSAKNLILKNNIFGKSINGWEVKTEEIKYSKEKNEISSNVGVIAINKEKDIEINGKNFKSDTKMENVLLIGDVKFKTKDITLTASEAKYSDRDKIVDIQGEATLSGKFTTNQVMNLDGKFKNLKFDTKTSILTTNNPFVIDYNSIKIFGEKLNLNTNTEAFEIRNNVYILNKDYKIDLDSITSDGGENIDFNGKIFGRNSLYTVVANNGIYNKITKEFKLIGDVVGTDKKGAKLTTELAIYSTEKKELELIDNKNVVYTDLENKLLTKYLKYSEEKGDIEAKNEYSFTGKKYSSQGKKFFYNKNTTIGYVIDGKINDKEQDIFILGKKIDFNKDKENYSIKGDAYFENKKYIITSQKIDFLGEKGYAYLPVEYIMKVKDKGDIFEGVKAEYNLSSEVFKSFGRFKYITSNDILEGINLEFNKKSKIGTVEKDVVLTKKDESLKIISENAIFKENEYVKLSKKIFLTSGDIVAEANSAEFKIPEDKIYFPEEINFENKVQKSTGKMYNGVYEIKKRIFTATNFTGKDIENNFKSDIIRYYTAENKIILEKNAEIKNTEMILKGNQLEYNQNTDIGYSPKPFTYKYSEYNIEGRSGEVGLKSGYLNAKDVVITMNQRDKIRGDIVKGTVKDMSLDFIDNVSGIVYEDNGPVEFSGDFARIYLIKDEFGKDKVQRVEIQNNAVIKKENETLYSDYLEIDVEKKLIFGKNNTKMVSKDKEGNITTVKSNMMRGDIEKEEIDLIGEVDIKREEKEKKIVATSNIGKVKNKENMIELRKNVRIDNGETIITADEVDYNTKINKIKARGNVFVEQRD